MIVRGPSEMVELAGISARDDVDLTLDTLFAFGLHCMLDGIAPLRGG